MSGRVQADRQLDSGAHTSRSLESCSGESAAVGETVNWMRRKQSSKSEDETRKLCLGNNCITRGREAVE